MSRSDKLFALILTSGILSILAGIVITALMTRIPVSHVFVNEAGARLIRKGGVAVIAVPFWPNVYRVNPKSTDAAFSSNATLYFKGHISVTLPRSDVRLWVYRG